MSAPPPAQVPALLQATLSALQLVTDPQQIDEVVAVLAELVKRDEGLVEGKMKLGDKLVKWSSIEGEKTANHTKASVIPSQLWEQLADSAVRHPQQSCHTFILTLLCYKR